MVPFLLANFLATSYFVPYLYGGQSPPYKYCLLYTSDAADEEDSVDLGGRRIIKKIFDTLSMKPALVIPGLEDVTSNNSDVNLLVEG